MIRKKAAPHLDSGVVAGFSLATNAERVCAGIMLKQKIERDDASKKSHLALGANHAVQNNRSIVARRDGASDDGDRTDAIVELVWLDPLIGAQRRGSCAAKVTADTRLICPSSGKSV
jgi:hypothetical protein